MHRPANGGRVFGFETRLALMEETESRRRLPQSDFLGVCPTTRSCSPPYNAQLLVLQQARARPNNAQVLPRSGIIPDPADGGRPLRSRAPFRLPCQHRKLQGKNRNDGGGDGKERLRDPDGEDFVCHVRSPLVESIEQ
jgi:hypothetical protein